MTTGRGIGRMRYDCLVTLKSNAGLAQFHHLPFCTGLNKVSISLWSLYLKYDAMAMLKTLDRNLSNHIKSVVLYPKPEKLEPDFT